MQISLTKKLAEAMAIKPAAAKEEANPLFSWTANWINTFENRKEDMIVMVNNAIRFTVIIYGVKRNQFKNIEAKMTAAIRNTLLALNVNTEVIDEYFKQAGEVEFATNHDRKMTAWVNRQGMDSAIIVGGIINESQILPKYNDTFGSAANNIIVSYGKNYDETYYPCEKMLECLGEITEKPIYKYRAFELLVTLDLKIYKATRRIIVPAELTFVQLHKVLQKVYNWENYHLYNFAILDKNSKEPKIRLVTAEEDLDYDDIAILMAEHRICEYLPENQSILYTYDLGDEWEHKIEFVREIKEYDKESPYLLEAVGQAPPEDVGGVGGFIDFREIMLNPNHPEYAQTNEWAGYWSPELSEWETSQHSIRL